MSFECIKSVKEKFFTNYGDSVTNRDSTYAQLPDGFKLDAERFVCEMNKAIKNLPQTLETTFIGEILFYT